MKIEKTECSYQATKGETINGNIFVIIHCAYTGRNYIYTKTIINGKICVDIVRVN